MSILSSRAITTLINNNALELQGQVVIGRSACEKLLTDLLIQQGRPAREAKKAVSIALQQVGLRCLVSGDNKMCGLY